MKRTLLIMVAAWACLLGLVRAVPALDSETSRQTLSGLRGVHVLVEDLQSNIVKLFDKFGFSKDQLQKNVELKLRGAGVKVLSRNEWLASPGRPILYVAVNTHQREKYWWAYDIRVELHQMASLEVNPATKAMVSTWSTNMTGVVNIGTLNTLNEPVKVLTDLFINAFLSVNPFSQRPKAAR
jgi:hypothetical protein